MEDGIVSDNGRFRFMTAAERAQYLRTRHVSDQLVVIVAPIAPCPMGDEYAIQANRGEDQDETKDD